MTHAIYRCRSCGDVQRPTQKELNDTRRELVAFAETDEEAAGVLASTDREIAAVIEFCPKCAELEKIELVLGADDVA